MVTTSGAADDDAPPPLLSGVVGWDKSAEQQKKEEEPTTIFADVKWNPSMRLEDLQAAVREQARLIRAMKQSGAGESKVSAAKAKLREMKKVQDDLKRQGQAKTYEKSTTSSSSTSSSTSTSSTSSTSTSTITSSTSSTSKSGSKSSKPAAETSDAHTNKFKGYKTLADGRKTTYFNRELSQQDAALIGSIAPKKIETSAATKPAAKAAPAGATSQWNSAGTWEEKNKTAWAMDRLRELLVCSQTVQLASSDDKVEFTEVKSIDGDAQICHVRGKKRYIFDFKITLGWDAFVEDKVYQGKLLLPDAASDCDGEYDCEMQWGKSRPPSSQQKQLVAALKGLATGALGNFVREFHGF